MMGLKAVHPPPDLITEVREEMLRLMTANAQALAASCTEVCIQQVWAACLACLAGEAEPAAEAPRARLQAAGELPGGVGTGAGAPGVPALAPAACEMRRRGGGGAAQDTPLVSFTSVGDQSWEALNVCAASAYFSRASTWEDLPEQLPTVQHTPVVVATPEVSTSQCNIPAHEQVLALLGPPAVAAAPPMPTCLTEHLPQTIASWEVLVEGPASSAVSSQICGQIWQAPDLSAVIHADTITAVHASPAEEEASAREGATRACATAAAETSGGLQEAVALLPDATAATCSGAAAPPCTLTGPVVGLLQEASEGLAVRRAGVEDGIVRNGNGAATGERALDPDATPPMPSMLEPDVNGDECSVDHELEALQHAVAMLTGQLATICTEAWEADAAAASDPAEGCERECVPASAGVELGAGKQEAPALGAPSASLTYVGRLTCRLAAEERPPGFGAAGAPACSVEGAPEASGEVDGVADLAEELNAFEDWLNRVVSAAAVMLDQRDHFLRLAAASPASRPGKGPGTALDEERRDRRAPRPRAGALGAAG